MKGSELIAEYLVQQKVPYVFGICGHGNVGMLDALHGVRDKVQLVSPRHEQCAGHMLYNGEGSANIQKIIIAEDALGYKLADRHHGRTGLRDMRQTDVAAAAAE